MRRYIYLYLAFLSASLQKALHFRVDFFFRILMDTVFYAVNIGFYFVVFEQVESFGGWSFDKILIFSALVLLQDALMMTFFSTGMHHFSMIINSGDLDYHLVRPVNPIFVLTFREFSFSSFVNLLMAIAFFVWTLFQYKGSMGPFEVMLLMVCLGMGTAIHYLVYLLVLLQVFWTQGGQGARNIHFNMMTFGERPHTIYPRVLRFVLISLLPYGVISSLPAQVFFGEQRWLGFLNILGVLIFLILLTRLVWPKAIRAYSSASS